MTLLFLIVVGIIALPIILILLAFVGLAFDDFEDSVRSVFQENIDE